MNPCRKQNESWPSRVIPGQRGRRGFTLVELLAVMTIIGIILSLVLIAGMDAARRAEERATQSLITKLEQGLNDRLEALLQNQPMPNYTHGYLAAMFSTNAESNGKPPNPLGMLPPPGILAGTLPIDNPAVKQTSRAQAIALFDYIKAEMPDVFYIQDLTPNTSTPAGINQYPLNFAGVVFLGTVILPLGHSVPGPFIASNGSFGDNFVSNPNLGPAGSGRFGASYAAAAGLYKGLGYLPLGYDGVDNDQDGTIDNYKEGITDPSSGTVDPMVSSPTNPNVKRNISVIIAEHLKNHTHVTARAEVLYALLVEGSGPLGSVFKREDFTDKEVQDTDGDGMPEFVDAWGQPLQFFRWPLLYHSDLQRGQAIVPDVSASTAGQWTLKAPYYYDSTATAMSGMLQMREQDPLDPNQQLMAPGWWSTVGTGGLAANNNPQTALAVTGAPPVSTGVSQSVRTFQALFHRLTEPLSGADGSTGNFWDRGTTYPFRRAFYSKFLILSAGPDTLPGVFLYANADINALGTGASPYLIANENNALPFSVGTRAGMDIADFHANPTVSSTTFPSTPSLDPTHPSSYDLQQAAQDDISNHNLQAGGAIGGSG
jgi:prepilin-type N-terminal cleavage/methylation domain-containing protein